MTMTVTALSARGAFRPLSLLRLSGAALALCSAAVLAQPHMASNDGYTLRSSTVPSTAIAPKAAKAHGIDPAPGRAVLNVMVERAGGNRENVQADLTVTARNLVGMEREIPMREARAPNGMLSYVGTFEFASLEVLDFEVRAVPRGSGTELNLRFRERLPRVPG